MNQKGILQIEELRLAARPYLQIVATAILFIGVLGGWAGSAAFEVLVVFGVMIFSIIVIGRRARLRESSPLHVYVSSAINLTAISIIVILTGGPHSPFWLLFFVGAVTSAMSFQGKAGVNLERLNTITAAFVLIVPVLLEMPLNGQSISLAVMQVLTLFGSSVMVRKITALILENRGLLNESEERDRTLIDAAWDVIVTLKPDGRITSLNPSFEAFTGWTRDEWLNRSFEGLVVEEDRPRAMDLFNRIVLGESLRALRVRIRSRITDDMVVEFNMSPQIEDGRVVGVLGIAREMTQEQREEDILRASEERFRALIENGWDAFMLADTQGAILYASPSTERVLGYTSQEITSVNVFTLFHPDDISLASDKLKDLIQKPGNTTTAQMRIHCKDDSWRWMEGVATNLFDEPKVQALVINYRDITERKQADEEKERLIQEFTLMDKVRTALAYELDLPTLFQTVVEAIAEFTDYELVSLFLKQGDELVLQHQVGYERIIKAFPVTQGISGRTIRTGKPILLNDVNADPDYVGAMDNITSEICIPLFENEKVVGILNVEKIGEIRLSENDLRLMVALGEHVNIAIGRARIYDDLQQNNRILSALQKSTLSLMKQLELSEVLQEILAQSSQLLGTQDGYIYVVEPDGEEIKVIFGMGVFSKYIGSTLKPGEGLAGKVWQSGQAMNVQDYYAWEGRSAQYSGTEFRAVVGVPLTSASGVVGILGLSHLDTGRVFHNDEVELLGRFAQLASIAFENGRLFTQAQQELTDRKMAEEALRNSEKRYRAIFQTSGVSIWEEDYSPILTMLDELHLQGVNDFREYLTEHPEFVQKAMEMLKVIDVNEMTIKLYGAKDKMEFFASSDKIFGTKSFESIKEELIVLAEGGEYFEGEVLDKKLTGEPLYLWRTIVFPKETTDFKSVLVCLTDITERKQMEDALLRRDAELTRAQAMAHLGNYSWDLLSGRIDWSDELKSIWGIGEQEPNFEYAVSHIHPGDRVFVEEAGRRTQEENAAFDIEYRIIRDDGSTRYIHDRAEVVQNADGSPIEMFGTILDITERKYAQETLQQSEERLRLIMESALDVIITIDNQGRVIDWNPQAEAVFGWKRTEAIGKNMADLIIPETFRMKHEKGLQGFMETGEGPLLGKRIEIDGLNRDGNTFPLELTITQIPTADGLTFTGFLRDITERKRAENELRTSEERYRNTLDNMLVGCQVIRSDWRYLYVNDEVAKQGRQSKENLIGNTMADVYPGIEDTEMFSILQTCMEERTTHRIENEFVYSDGSSKWFDMGIQPVPEGIFIVSIDITEHKQAEKLQRTINRIANAVLTTGSLSELFPKIHKALEGILLFKSFYIALYDREEELISFPYFVDQYDEPPPPQKPGHGLTEYVLRTQKPLLATRNILDELVRKGEADLIGGDSNEWLGVPLILKGEVLGVMVVQTYEEEVHFSQRAVDILTYVSTQVANAIERKRTEEDLRAAEVRYRTLVEQIPAIVYIAGPQQYIGETYISPQIKQLGFTQEEWVADPDRWLKQLHPEDRERVLAEIEEMKEEQRSFQSEYRLFDREGQARWIHDETLHVKNQEGKPILLQGIMLDITDRKEAEERIKRQLEQLKTQRTIDMTILASTDLKLSLREILKQGLSQLQVDAIDILFLNTTTHFLEYKDGMGFHTKDIERTKLRVGEGYAGRAIRERKMVNVQDFNAMKFAFTRSELIAKEKFVSYWGMPLIVKGEVKGILEVFLRSRLQPDADWMNFFESLAGQTALAIDNATLFENLRRSNFELVRAYETTLEGWSSALDLRDKETEGHTKRVTTLTLQLAQTIGISDKELVHIRRGALLHDIGKMGVPDRILLKPDQLTDDEWEIMRQHPTYAKNLLSPIEYLRPSIDIPYSHHEKWDGTGYPMGLKGEQIPLAARIFAVTDVYDALTSDRPYRPAWTREKTLEQIKSLSGTHFDPKVVDAFLGLLK